MQAKVFLHAQAALGEGPLWDDARGCLFFVDIEGRKLHQVTMEGEDTVYDMPSRIGTVGLTRSRRLIVALEAGLYLFDPEERSFEFLAQPETDRTGNRGNDGKPDPAGNMWIGTMPMEQGKLGALYRVTPDRASINVIDGLGCANGMGWSPDHKTMYFIDTPSRAVWAFDFDQLTSGISNRRVAVDFVQAAESEGGPDGMTVDAEGKLWVAQWGGMQVARYDNLTGEKLEQVDVPAPCTSCPTFGGENLDKLFITTAGFGREKYPLAGDLFVADVGVKGMKAFRFGRE
jgi:sugar lactone lactonase YvrE